MPARQQISRFVVLIVDVVVFLPYFFPNTVPGRSEGSEV
jgi:hypothetical protein